MLKTINFVYYKIGIGAFSSFNQILTFLFKTRCLYHFWVVSTEMFIIVKQIHEVKAGQVQLEN